MRGVNKAIIVGTLGRDPEVRAAASGNTIANLSVATNESWTDKTTGQKQEKTEWHRVVLFGKLAEIAAQYLRMGSKVYLEGKLQARKWTDQNGMERYTTEIVANEMQMLGGGQQAQQPVQQPVQQPAGMAPPPVPPLPAGDGFDQEVPF